MISNPVNCWRERKPALTLQIIKRENNLCRILWDRCWRRIWKGHKQSKRTFERKERLEFIHLLRLLATSLFFPHNNKLRLVFVIFYHLILDWNLICYYSLELRFCVIILIKKKSLKIFFRISVFFSLLNRIKRTKNYFYDNSFKWKMSNELNQKKLKMDSFK